MDDDGIFYRHLVHFTVFCSSLWTVGNLVYFSRFGILYQEKSGNPAGANPTTKEVITRHNASAVVGLSVFRSQ
jgi:hypothetical protein